MFALQKCLSDGQYLLCNHREYFYVYSVELVQASPWASVGQTWK